MENDVRIILPQLFSDILEAMVLLAVPANLE